MRAILVGVAAVAVMAGVANQVLAGGNVADEPRAGDEVRASAAAEPVEEPMSDAGIHETPPFEGVVSEETHSAGEELGMGVGATVFSLLYSPIRLAVGIVGAELGGIAGWSAGGDMRTARALWRPTVEGDYYITPDHFDGEKQFRFSNVEPVVRETNSLRGRDAVASDSARGASAVSNARCASSDDYLQAAPASEQP